MNQHILFLSKNRKFLTDELDKNVLIRTIENDSIYYIAIGIESEAYEKKCLETSVMKVCTQWNGLHSCDAWDEVDVCTKWELIPKGFGNIS